jgi:transcriptional regulator with XRE-family HTH domain
MKKNEFGRHLNAIRISKNISLDELANETQIASWVLWLYEEGREIPKKPKVHAIARVLGCDARNLLDSRKYSLAEKRRNINEI